MRKWLYISVGIIGLGLGAVGAVMPMLPAFPFLMLAAYCFGKSSERLDQWFRNTKLYKDNLEDYVSGRGMTRKAKIRVVITVTVLMSIGFLIMFGKGIFIGCDPPEDIALAPYCSGQGFLLHIAISPSFCLFRHCFHSKEEIQDMKDPDCGQHSTHLYRKWNV